MNAKLPEIAERLKTPPAHYSYLKHRKQVMRQILMPVLLSALVLVAIVVLISYSTFNQGGDVGRHPVGHGALHVVDEPPGDGRRRLVGAPQRASYTRGLALTLG